VLEEGWTAPGSKPISSQWFSSCPQTTGSRLSSHCNLLPYAIEMNEKVSYEVIEDRLNRAVQVLEKKGISYLSPSLKITV